MKRSTLLIAVIFAAINTSFSQSYFHSPGDTIIANAVFNDVNVYNIIQTHPTPDTIYFKWYKHSVEMPFTWEASICDNGNCHTSLLDSGMMDPIVPGDNGLMSLHIDPKSEAGRAIIRYTLFATNTPGQVDTLTWIISASGATGIASPNIAEPLIRISGQSINCTNLAGAYNTAFLYDATGKLLAHETITGNEINIPVQAYRNQAFILQLKGRRNFIKKILKY